MVRWLGRADGGCVGGDADLSSGRGGALEQEEQEQEQEQEAEEQQRKSGQWTADKSHKHTREGGQRRSGVRDGDVGEEAIGWAVAWICQTTGPPEALGNEQGHPAPRLPMGTGQ
ncbi:hypothetical protein ACN47E_003058 [Coniothyrium glycines]